MRLLDLAFQEVRTAFNTYTIRYYTASHGNFIYNWIPDDATLCVWLWVECKHLSIKEPLLTLFRIKYP